ncbi:DEAD/DEAH box helicase [Entomomonas asaccharolytica]|uniref:DEAD/DEAH box helicase n=1 Tax=Entomomonas asaccharolytica TaxID=2785331 RepID=A0A974RWR1_9GAMM|nr:DEAD/DEAH box helicase [Entomomonas asaccharolytica]QQP85402.1 DEAD/DEAH box helicase [Entomomonas asaccharolytica]
MFDKFNLNSRLVKALTTSALTTPTTVQEKTIPLAMAGKDLFITSATGTGKTLAYVLPLLHRLLETTKPASGLQALIILPTRELATQTYKTIQQIARFTFFQSLLVTGGEGLKEQAAKLRKNPDIVIGTPGRLVEHWKKQQFDLNNLKILVLDEADRILDMGFGEDVNTIIENCPANKQTLLLSATKGNNALQALIENLLLSPINIHLETSTKANSNISQQIIFADNTAHKQRLIEWLLAHESYQKTIIFTNTRNQADLLSKTFTATQIKHAVLHSEKTAEERKQTISRLHQKHITILIATDVAARGLDIEGIDLVINFDLPRTTDEYIHRIGRTGRMDNKGTAISLIDADNWKALTKIEHHLHQTLEKRTIESLAGKFQGLTDEKVTGKKPANPSTKAKIKTKSHKEKKPSSRAKEQISTLVSSDGFAPLKRKK